MLFFHVLYSETFQGGVMMEDSKIVEMYWDRNEEAISETKLKYENYLSKIAYNILADIEDSRESVNDTYLRAWYSMPPHKPDSLSAFLGKITRRISIDIYRKKNSKKRAGSEYAISLDELYDCASAEGEPEKEIDSKILSDALNRWLNSVSEDTRNIFICRYFYCDSIRDIADYTGSSRSKIKSSLHRARLSLKDYLIKEELL